MITDKARLGRVEQALDQLRQADSITDKQAHQFDRLLRLRTELLAKIGGEPDPEVADPVAAYDTKAKRTAALAAKGLGARLPDRTRDRR